MAELTADQLILLDNLIYLKDVANKDNMFVGDIIEDLLKKGGGLDKSRNPKHAGTVKEYPAMMSRPEWEKILNAIKNDKELTSLMVTHGDPGYLYDKQGRKLTDNHGTPLESGSRVATFVNLKTKEATVIFRGTAGDYEWYDNGQGGYLSETKQQKEALQYIEGLPYDNITVSGHSKGGNKTQFVAIMSDKVDRAVSLDGQGFSKEFLEKNKDRIEANRHKITSISAENDYVNCLLHPVADTVKYIDTEEMGLGGFLLNHKPNLVLKDNGQLRDPADQGDIPKFINSFTIYANEHISDPERSFMIDGLISFMQDEENDGVDGKSFPEKLAAVLLAVSHLDDYFFEEVVYENFGGVAELLLTGVLAFAFPRLFMDDYVRALERNFLHAIDLCIEKLKQFGDWLMGVLEAAVEKFKELERQVSLALIQFVKDVQEGWNRFKGWVADFAEDVKNGAIEAAQAMERFKDKIAKAVTSFFQSIAEGTKKIIKAIGDWWDQAVAKLKNTAADTVDRVKQDLVKEYLQFRVTVELMIELPKIAAESALTQASSSGAPPQYAKKVLRGYGSYTSAQLAIDFSRLTDLQTRITKLEEEFGSTIQRVTSDVGRITSSVGRSYSESNVQRQIHLVQSSCSRVSQYSRQLADELQKRARSLKYSGEQYRKIEAMLC